MNESDLREAVEQPAALFGVEFEPGLAQLIVQDVGSEPGSLPLLEFCLPQLWERQAFRRITHEAYSAIGGVQQALANHADAVYAEFDEQDKVRLRHIFLKLVRPGQGTEDTRHVATLEQIRPENREVITRLADRRLVVTGRVEEEDTVEVVHEALIRRWQTLRQWVNEDREFLVWQEKLRVLLRQWQDSNQDEGALLRGLPLDEALKWRESHAEYLAEDELEFIETGGQLKKKEQQAKKRRGQYLVIGLVGAVILAVLAGMFGLQAKKQQKIAEQKTVEAKRQTLAANYNLAKAFEEKALSAWRQAQQKQSNEAYKQAVLFTSAALEQDIEEDKFALERESITKLFAPEVFYRAWPLAEQWISPVAKIHESSVISVAFSPDGKTLT